MDKLDKDQLFQLRLMMSLLIVEFDNLKISQGNILSELNIK